MYVFIVLNKQIYNQIKSNKTFWAWSRDVINQTNKTIIYPLSLKKNIYVYYDINAFLYTYRNKNLILVAQWEVDQA